MKAAKTYSDQEIYDNGLGDTRGYYEDGAYVARASLGPQLPETQTEHALVSPQEAFTFILKQRFLKQRQQLQLSPGPDALKQLDEKHPISFPANNSKAYGDWLRLLRSKTPLPAQVRAIQQPEV